MRERERGRGRERVREKEREESESRQISNAKTVIVRLLKCLSHAS